MEVEVYADLLFLINAGMDGLCFCLTGRLLHRKLSPWRVLLGAVIGGMYAVVALLPDLGHAMALLWDVGICLVMCAIVFAGKGSGGGRFFLSTVVYFVLSMVLGGVMTALYNLLNRVGFAEFLPEGEDGLGTWLFALLALVGSGITLWGGRFFRRSATVRHCRVAVELEGHRVELEGMVDTGNLLRDPLSGRAVICAERQSLTAVLSPALADVLQNSNDITSLSAPTDARRLRLIPAGTATGNGILVGILPDRVEITYTDKKREQLRVVDAVIAAADLNETQALVPSELMDSF